MVSRNTELRFQRTAILILATFVGLLGVSIYPSLVRSLALFPAAPLYTFVTYALIQDGLLSWLHTAFSLTCSGLLIERELTASQYWGLVVGSTVVTSVGYTVLMFQQASLVGLVGTNGVAWGFGGAVVVFGLMRWRELRWLARLYIIYVALSFATKLSGLLDWDVNAPLDVSHLFTAVCGVALAVWVSRIRLGPARTI